MSVAIQWFENPTFDAPELKSPQPCIHGAGCVYTKTLPDGKIVPAVCRYVHPGEEGKGRRLFPARTIIFEHPDGDDVVEQPACVRLIGNALYYERMRMQMPWQGFCAVRGIPFTANVPGVFREPVRRVPIGGSKPKGSPQNRPSFQSPPPPRPSTEVPIRHTRTLAHVAGLPVEQDFLITAKCVTLLKPEEAAGRPLNPLEGEALMRPALAAAEAAAIAAQSEQQKAARWAKQLEYARAHKIYVTQQRAAHEATRRREQEIYAQRVSAGEWLPGMTTLLKPIPHAVVESEVIAASNPPLQAEAAGEAVDRAMEKAQPLAPGVAGAEQAEPDCSAAEQAAAIAAQSHQQKAAPLGLAWQPNIYVKIGKNRYPIRL